MEDISPMGIGLQTPLHNTSVPKKRSLKKLLILIAVILLLLGGGYFGIKHLFGKGSRSEQAQVTPTSTPPAGGSPTETPTDTPTPEKSPTPEATKIPTPKPTTNPVDKTTGLDRSQLTVEIQNGSGTAGVAGKASDFLKNLGYQVAKTGNADNFDYKGVTISIKSDFAKYLPLLKSDVSANYTIQTATSDLSASSSADALVIIGK